MHHDLSFNFHKKYLFKLEVRTTPNFPFNSHRDVYKYKWALNIDLYITK